MHVDPKWHRHFVAKRGELLHEISDQNGGVTISFPRSGVDSDRVVLKGEFPGFNYCRTARAAKNIRSRSRRCIKAFRHTHTIKCILTIIINNIKKKKWNSDRRLESGKQLPILCLVWQVSTSTHSTPPDHHWMSHFSIRFLASLSAIKKFMKLSFSLLNTTVVGTIHF